MPTLIKKPTIVKAAGNKPKVINEYFGRASSKTTAVSIAHMQSPAGWKEPGQTPKFDEYTVVMNGTLIVEHKGGTLEVKSGQGAHVKAGEWVRYSSPEETEYLAVCLPAFSDETVNRD